MPRLFTHNVQVDKWNEFQLSGLPGDDTVLDAVQTGPDHQRAFLVKNLLTPATLRLKPGALVMFTVNKNEPGRTEPLFVNGQIGTVEAVEPGAVVVRCKGGETIHVERFTWRYDAQDEDSASFAQFPLRLAWAMTIHKVQGLTLDPAFLDIRTARDQRSTREGVPWCAFQFSEHRASRRAACELTFPPSNASQHCLSARGTCWIAGSVPRIGGRWMTISANGV